MPTDIYWKKSQKKRSKIQRKCGKKEKEKKASCCKEKKRKAREQRFLSPTQHQETSRSISINQSDDTP
jgi:hypothetical protein